MKQLLYLTLGTLLLSSQTSLILSQSTPTTPTDNNTQAANWLDSALTTILNNFNTGTNQSSGIMVAGSATPRSTSQAVYSVIQPDGSSTTTTYFTDPDGVTTTNVQQKPPSN